jgi:HEAT repeat protein
MGIVEKGTWLETWIAIGLLELGDATHIELARAALANPSWDFTAVRVATALAKHGDLSGIAALERIYQRAAQGLEPETGKAVVAFLGGAGDLYLADRGDREQRLIRLRRQIANALATIDEPESVPLLATILEDSDESVRTAAAYALARMSDPAAVAGLVKAIAVDYGAIGQVSRNPAVHAHIVRSAAVHADVPETRAVLETGKASSSVSVQFLALAEERGLGLTAPSR